MRSLLFLSAAFAFAAVLLPCPASAQDDEASMVRIESMSIAVKINGRLATTTMDLTFASIRDDGQAVLQWRIAPDAVVHDLVLWVNNLRIPCEVCPRSAARATYDRIVSGNRDPAIVEYIGNGVWNLSVFPVSLNNPRKVRVVYSQMLNRACEYRAPAILKESPCRRAGMFEFEAEVDCPGGVSDITTGRKVGVSRRGRTANNPGKVIIAG